MKFKAGLCLFSFMWALPYAVFAYNVTYYNFTSCYNYSPYDPNTSTGNKIMDFRRDGVVNDNDRMLMSFVFDVLYNPATPQSVGEFPEQESVEPAVFGKPLFYPNPFRLSEGAMLGYRLSKDLDIEIRIYNMLAQEIFRGYYMAGTPGGVRGYNRLMFTSYTMNQFNLPSGVYFVLIMNKGNLLAKAKFAIKP